MRNDPFELARKEKIRGSLMVIKRFLPKPISRTEKKRLLLIIDAECPHAIESLYTRFSPSMITREENLCIWMGRKNISKRFKLLFDIKIVIYLSIKHYSKLVIWLWIVILIPGTVGLEKKHGLMPCQREIYDRESILSECNSPIFIFINKYPSIIRTTMMERFIHLFYPFDESFLWNSRWYNAIYSAHSWIILEAFVTWESFMTEFSFYIKNDSFRIQ